MFAFAPCRHHFDFYRVGPRGTAAGLEVDTAFRDSDCVVEWPEEAPPECFAAMPPHRLHVAVTVARGEGGGGSLGLGSDGPGARNSCTTASSGVKSVAGDRGSFCGGGSEDRRWDEQVPPGRVVVLTATGQGYAALLAAVQEAVASDGVHPDVALR